jgi:hypothetical protein
MPPACFLNAPTVLQALISYFGYCKTQKRKLLGFLFTYTFLFAANLAIENNIFICYNQFIEKPE